MRTYEIHCLWLTQSVIAADYYPHNNNMNRLVSRIRTKYGVASAVDVGGILHLSEKGMRGRLQRVQ